VANFLAAGMLPLPQGRFFMIKTATAALTINARRRDGQPVEFVNVGAGLQYNALETLGWYVLEVTSAVAQVVEIVISDEAAVTFANAVSVTGVTQTTESPFPTFAPPPDVSIAAASHLDIPANPARRAIVIGSLASNVPATTNLRVRDASGTAAAGPELQPGLSTRVPTTAALRIRNNDANAQSVWYYEEL
jgi:hypothetical protein